jgi:hypothetical protein
VRGACASGDGGWYGPEEAEAVWRCREKGVLLDGTGDSGSGSVVNGSEPRNEVPSERDEAEAKAIGSCMAGRENSVEGEVLGANGQSD